MRVLAFAGTRYAASPEAAGRLAAPPFDQIDDSLRNSLQQTPSHFAHLTRPLAGASRTPAAAAARLHRRWSDQGVVIREREPSIYLYSIELRGGGTRLGLCALLGLEPPGSPAIRPHESTLAATVAERLELLRETRIDLEPILVLSEDEGELDRLLAEDLRRGEPTAEHRDHEGNLHRLQRIVGRSSLSRYRELLAGVGAVIADGHHRYEVARQLAAETPAAGGAPHAKLAVVTSLSSPALTIAPIHRALRRPPPDEALRELAVAGESWRGSGGSALARAVADAPQPTIGLLAAGEEPRILGLSAAGSDRSPLPEPAVVLLHDRVLPRLGLGAGAATDGRVIYRSDPDRLLAEVHGGRLPVGFWLPPLAPADFARAVADGSLLPPKSTRFLPKLVSGLVWAEHDTPIA